MSEPSDRELREWLWKNHGHVALYGDDGEMQCPECNPWDYKRAPLLAVVRAAFAAVRTSHWCRDEQLWRAEIEKVRAYTPTLTAEDVQKIAYQLLLPERTWEWSEHTAAKFAELASAILAAKSQKGGDANWNDRKKQTDLSNCSTDRGRTEPVKANECETPSAAWDRAMEKAAEEIDRELRWRTTEVDDTGRSLAPGFMRPLDELARAIRALRGKYEESNREGVTDAAKRGDVL